MLASLQMIESQAETRSHLGGWAILVSSQLILNHDVKNDTVMGRVWDILNNREVLAVNQAYVGDSGGVYDWATSTVTLHDSHQDDDSFSVQVPAYQHLSKPIGRLEGKKPLC
jgi:hypothetical protein